MPLSSGLDVLAEEDVAVPETMSDTFRRLQEAECIPSSLAGRLIKAVGFRNVAVHAYDDIDWAIVYTIITKHMDDFRQYARLILALLDRPSGG